MLQRLAARLWELLMMQSMLGMGVLWGHLLCGGCCTSALHAEKRGSPTSTHTNTPLMHVPSSVHTPA